jgi:oligopeptide/dipeptide ABC transporter ATP-binding protein
MSSIRMPATGPETPVAEETLLEIEDLHVQFNLRSATVFAVNGVSLRLRRGETLGIVGESGSGKSVTAMSVLRLLPGPPATATRGSIRFLGRDMLALPPAELRGIRGKDISMVFQEPMTSLNPVVTIGEQISEAIILHQGLSRADAAAAAANMLRLVRISEPERRLGDYPHQLSGGMRQRVMIAMALSCNPQILLADEPTTALDVTIQAALLNLMNELQQRLGTSIILITHDLGLVAENADRVMVMYGGRTVEEGETDQLFSTPLHPYTRGLLKAIPSSDPGSETSRPGRARLHEIKGTVPSLRQPVVGCTFAPRCPHAADVCRSTAPHLADYGAGHKAACWFAADIADGRP